jgi:hypothetical protein
MKQLRFLIGLVACSLALATGSTLLAQTAQDGIAKVVNIKGSARYMSSPGGTWQPLKIGVILKSGAVIQTAAGSYADLVLNNSEAKITASPMATSVSYGGYSQATATQDAVRLFENTVLGIDQLAVTQTGADRVTETQLDLKAGRILGTVKKLSAASKYEVKIPNGVAGIRGTIYTLSADGVLSVLSGSVVFAYIAPDGTVLTQVVTAGQEFDSRTGQLTAISQDDKDNYTAMAQVFVTSNEPIVFVNDPRVESVSPHHGHRPPGIPPGPPPHP